MKKFIVRLILILLLGLLGFAVFIGLNGWNIKAVAYQPPEPPVLNGVLAPNDRLEKAEVFARGKIKGGEDVAIDAQGRIYSGSVEDGKIYLVILTDGAEKIEVFADLGKMPVGLKFDRAGNLIVCHQPKGLLSISPDGRVTTLTEAAEGEKFGFIDDLDIAADGKIYFTDATTEFTGLNGKLGWEYELLESRPHGRFLVYEPDTGQTKFLLKDLYFANGVAVSQNNDFVLVNETFRNRVVRYWLKGEKAGTWDYFAENLPGYPDGILGDGKGNFWVSLPTKREWIGEFLQPKPFLKNIITALPKNWWLRTTNYGLVIKLNEKGEITESLHDPTGQLAFITNAVEYEGYLYLGTLKGDWLARVKLSESEK